jgi:hypothetical protein
MKEFLREFISDPRIGLERKRKNYRKGVEKGQYLTK